MAIRDVCLTMAYVYKHENLICDSDHNFTDVICNAISCLFYCYLFKDDFTIESSFEIKEEEGKN